MTTGRPRIAIPEPTSTDDAYNQRSLPKYIQAIEAAGGTAVPIRLQDPAEAQTEALNTCSGILLPGSPADVDPALYGEQPIQACGPKDAPREAADELMLRHAFEQNKPILGICFGMQSLNVWRHGTLIQDLPRAGSDPGAVNHQPGREVLDAHQVLVASGSRVSQIVLGLEGDTKDNRLQVNSSHHQAIKQPGEMLKIAARSCGDGVIEALEIDSTDSQNFVLAVQWHPERSYDHSPASRALFSTFLAAARNWGSARQASGATVGSGEDLPVRVEADPA